MSSVRNPEENGHQERDDECCAVVQLVLLLLNLILIIAIFIVSILWSTLRNESIMEMISAPEGDRSICASPGTADGKCLKMMPEKYISGEIDKVSIFCFLNCIISHTPSPKNCPKQTTLSLNSILFLFGALWLYGLYVLLKSLNEMITQIYKYMQITGA